MSNLDIIKELYRAFATKDYDTFLNICDPGLEWIQNEGFPNGQKHIGSQAVVDNVFKAFNNEWETWKFQIENYLDAGESIIVLGNYQGIHRTTGKSCCAAAAHVYELEKGKVRRFRQFTDTKVIWDAMVS